MIASIFDNKVWTLSVTLSWLPVAPEATKVIGVPLTVMVSPGAKLACNESVPAAPDSAVAPVTARGRNGLVVDGAAGRRAVGVEEIVAGRDRRGRDQRGAGERADRRGQRGLEICRRRRRRRADGEAAGRQSACCSRPSTESDSVVPSGRLKEKLIWSPGFGLPAVMSTDTDGRRAGRAGDRRRWSATTTPSSA